MMRFSIAGSLSCLALFVLTPGGSTSCVGQAVGTRELIMPALIEQFTADRASLQRTYNLEISAAHMERFSKFYTEEIHAMDAVDFDHLAHADQVDYLLLRNLLISQIHQQEIRKKQIEAMAPLLPFEKNVESLIEARRLMKRPDGEKTAAMLTEITRQIKVARQNFEPTSSGSEKDSTSKPQVDRVVANRAVNAIHEISDALHDWFNQYHGYDPSFTWWVDQPFHETDSALTDYSKFLKEKLIGIAPDDKTPIIGDPVGRDALVAELQDTLIPYTPEELVAIAQTEYDWCMKEMLKASHEMGYGDDWHAAVEKVKTMH